MRQKFDFLYRLLMAVVLACPIMAVFAGSGAIASKTVVYAFHGGSDGAEPFGALIADEAGNLYGTTVSGGGGACSTGCGTVFKLAADGRERVLWAFRGGSDGAYPQGALVSDGVGDFYGTTPEGGAYNVGTLFKLAPHGTETVVYTFKGGSDGFVPNGGLIMDGNGNLYGTTPVGGNYVAACGGDGCGVVFKVAPDGTETVLYAFCSQTNCSDGANPVAGLIADDNGNFYGTTIAGGTGTCSGFLNCGTVFKLTPDDTESVLYSFQGGSDGAFPGDSLIADNLGNFYGTTSGGGGCATSGECGTVFKLAPDGTEIVLHAFQAGRDGDDPEAGLIMDKAGNLYGTTFAGGGTGCGHGGCGIAFKVAPDGTEKVLSRFGLLRGSNPSAALIEGKHHLLYGTATAGGFYKEGVVFSVTK
jgi:uncharacterized repeat protein (TIGR03803 family)